MVRGHGGGRLGGCGRYSKATWVWRVGDVAARRYSGGGGGGGGNGDARQGLVHFCRGHPPIKILDLQPFDVASDGRHLAFALLFKFGPGAVHFVQQLGRVIDERRIDTRGGRCAGDLAVRTKVEDEMTRCR